MAMIYYAFSYHLRPKIQLWIPSSEPCYYNTLPQNHSSLFLQHRLLLYLLRHGFLQKLTFSQTKIKFPKVILEIKIPYLQKITTTLPVAGRYHDACFTVRETEAHMSMIWQSESLWQNPVRPMETGGSKNLQIYCRHPILYDMNEYKCRRQPGSFSWLWMFQLLSTDCDKW